MHGKGSYYEKSTDSKYTGNFVDDKKQGSGKLEFIDKNLSYNGGFLANKYHGHGKAKFEDGSEYNGLFKDGMFNGIGTMTSPNGMCYEGLKLFFNITRFVGWWQNGR